MRRRSPVLLLLALALASLAVPTTAGAYVYWNDAGTIGRVGNDGSEPDKTFIVGAEAAPMAADADNFWYTTAEEDNQGGDLIARTNPGGGEFTLLPEGSSPQTEAEGIGATDGKHIYWASLTGIGRASLDGSEAEPEFIQADAAPEMGGIAVYDNYVYWTYYNGGFGGLIGRANLSTKLVEEEYLSLEEIPEALGPRAIAVDDQGIYWVMDPEFGGKYAGDIGQAGFGGKPVPDAISGIDAQSLGLAIAGSDLYWCNYSPGTGDSLAHAELHGGGTTVDTHFVDGACLTYIAVNSASGPPPPPPPPPPSGETGSGSGEAGPGPGRGPTPAPIVPPGPIAPALVAPLPKPRLKLNAKAGTATLTVTVPGPGSVALSGTGIKRLTKRAKAAGPVSLTVSPTGKSAARLRKAGKVALTADLTFTPTGGIPSTRAVKLKLKLG